MFKIDILWVFFFSLSLTDSTGWMSGLCEICLVSSVGAPPARSTEDLRQVVEVVEEGRGLLRCSLGKACLTEMPQAMDK